MAEKMAFISKAFDVEEKIFSYTYYSGFSLSQKQKSIKSLHNAIKEQYPEKKILEISSKSPDTIGVQLSAFNLKYTDKELQLSTTVENVFQSSKVFENGGPYTDLLYVAPHVAKKDERLKNSGQLTAFELLGNIWSIKPKTFFYDWIYINALAQHIDLADKILEYDIFTDIEFNHRKSINCQAHSAALFVMLKRTEQLDHVLRDKSAFMKLYTQSIDSTSEQEKQISMFL